jgi:hypothetical protein
MSPTSYQTAPPRDLMIATVLLRVKLCGETSLRKIDSSKGAFRAESNDSKPIS